MILGIPYTHVNDVWGEIEEWIEISCKRGGGKYVADDILQCLLRRELQLWAAVDGAIKAIAITEIVLYPRKKVLRIHLGAGDYKHHFTALTKEIQAWGSANGCTSAEAIARPAFGNFLKAMGWRKSQIYMERDL